MRYVKIAGSDPGFRFDLLRGRMVYSSRFLNAEEHLLDGRVAEAWSAMWCFLISVPLFLRTKTPRLLWNLFAIIGMGYTLAILLDAYLRARGQ